MTAISGIEYTTCFQAWGCDMDLVTLRHHDTILGHIPMDFLREGKPSGLQASFLSEILKILLKLPVNCELSLCHEGQQITLDDCIARGDYDVSLPEDVTLEHRPGPQGKSKIKPFRDTDGQSTVSDSARSTMNQTKFREKLLLRDGGCIATGVDNEEILIAAHIVPLTLGQDFLNTLTTIPKQVTLFSVTNGLLLTPDLHHAYDRYLWGIYVEGNMQFIHVFGDLYRELHGKPVEYRSRNRAKLPNIRLLNWHYTQCVLARIRGHYVKIIGQRTS